MPAFYFLNSLYLLISDPETLTPVGDISFFTNPTSHFLSFSASPFPNLVFPCLFVSLSFWVFDPPPPGRL